MAGVQASAPDALAQPQQARESSPDKQLEEEQKGPALDSAGLPQQDGKCGNEIQCGPYEHSHANLSHYVLLLLL